MRFDYSEYFVLFRSKDKGQKLNYQVTRVTLTSAVDFEVLCVMMNAMCVIR